MRTRLLTLANRFLLLTLLHVSGPRCFGVLANAWHIPDNSFDLGLHMRSPEFEFGTNTAVTVYQGVQRYNNPYGTARQTGGTLYIKGSTQTNWSSNSLAFYLNGGPSRNNQFT